MNNKSNLSFLFSYILKYKFSFFLAIFLTIVISLLSLLPQYIQGLVINVLETRNNTNILYLYLGVFILQIILTFLLSYINQRILQTKGQYVMKDIRDKLYEHITHLGVKELAYENVGKIISRITSDTVALNDYFSNVFVSIISYSFTIIAILIIMFFINLKLFLYVILFIPILLLLTILFKVFSKKIYSSVRLNNQYVIEKINENLSGVKVIQAFNQEKKRQELFINTNKKLLKSNLNEVVVFSLFQPLIYLAYVLLQIFVIYNGFMLIKNNLLSVSLFVSFNLYLTSLFSPISLLSDLFSSIQSANASVKRIKEILNITNKTDYTVGLTKEKLDGVIEFKDVYFKYKEENDYVLKNINLKINKNESVAFIGKTGCGKSTILSLLMRYYDVSSGNILIDGKNIKEYSCKNLRKNIGFMAQDVSIFTTSIKNNITMFDINPNEIEILKTVKQTGYDKYLDKYDDKLNYVLQDKGSNLSFGERQLLSFTRTIYKNPSIYILDEATSNIDSKSEKQIKELIDKLKKDHTVIIVAHRLNTIRECDKIVLIENGNIKEMGTHEELLKLDGEYKKMVEASV